MPFPNSIADGGLTQSRPNRRVLHRNVLGHAVSGHACVTPFVEKKVAALAAEQLPAPYVHRQGDFSST
jgi:hypothetical protein